MDTSGLAQAAGQPVPVYMVSSHADETGMTGLTDPVIQALGMTRADPGGTSVMASEHDLTVVAHDPEVRLDISYPLWPYLVYNDMQRGPGCNPTVRTCTPSTAAAPTGDAAIKQLTRVMTKLGFNTGSFTFTAQPLPSATPSTLVWALPATHGAPLDEDTLQELDVPYFSGGATWSATVTADGIVRLEAELVEVTEVTTVQPLSPAASATRLTDPAFALSVSESKLPWNEGTAAAPAAPVLTPGAPIPWGVHHHVWSTATQTWASRTTSTYGQLIYLPAWRLSTGPDGGRGTGWSVVSVPDSMLHRENRVAFKPHWMTF